MSVTKEYLEKGKDIISVVAEQEETIQEVAKLFAKSILAGRMVHLFGSGHSRMLVEEMWPRYGSFPFTIWSLVPMDNDRPCFWRMFLDLPPGSLGILIRASKILH